MTADAPQVDPSEPTSLWRWLFAGQGWAMLALAVATLAVELGTYLLARYWGVPTVRAVPASLLVSTLWIALAAPIAAASERKFWGSLLRGATVIDATGISLLALWLFARSPDGVEWVPLLAAVEIYLILTAFALAGMALTYCARREATRLSLALTATVVMLAIVFSPF